MLDFRGKDCALADSIPRAEAPAMASEPAAEVFKKLRRDDCVILAPMIVSQFIADPQMKKPPEGGFGVSWWPGAESIKAWDALMYKNMLILPDDLKLCGYRSE
jgi:hypothetical protein